VLDRVAQPDTVRHAFYHLRDAGFANISLDLIYGIPGQSPSALEADLGEALALEPEHLSCYELEAKPGTRFTHAHGAELVRQSEVMESYFELVVERLTDAGYRWYETANFCRAPDAVGGRDVRAQHNLAYWLGKDYLGVGVGAVSTIENRRWRNTPRVAAYLGALGRRDRPDRELEPLSETVRLEERVMLGLRLDQPLALAPVAAALDEGALERMERLGLASVAGRPDEATVSLTRRGRLLGGGVTAEILA
jgi:coproporphyrinogen III oxidase-like Fe-S oxidoreductase